MVPPSREQGDFRDGRSTLDQINCLDLIIKAQPRPVDLAAFLDIKTAYDSVPRAELWRRCEILGLPGFITRNLQAMFDHNSSNLVINEIHVSDYNSPLNTRLINVLGPGLKYARLRRLHPTDTGPGVI